MGPLLEKKYASTKACGEKWRSYALDRGPGTPTP
jgi:hypothetical protein